MRCFLCSLCVCGLACAVAGAAESVTLWLPGVSETAGWTDYNKTASDTEDDNLCWAASGSNVINWWQNQYSGLTDLPPQGVEIWDTFQQSVAGDMAGHPFCAFQWWLTGQYNWNADNADYAYHSTSVQSIENGTYKTSPGFEGFYRDIENYSDSFNWSAEIADFMDFIPVSESVPEKLGFTVAEALAGGSAATISLGREGGGVGHSITLWGAEYDADSLDLVGLWLTDSDDEQKGMNTNGLFYVKTKQVEYAGSSYLTFDVNPGEWYYGQNGVFGNTSYYINLIEFYNTSVSDSWGGLKRLVPEPAAASLGLLAMLGLVSRRRRRH